MSRIISSGGSRSRRFMPPNSIPGRHGTLMEKHLLLRQYVLERGRNLSAKKPVMGRIVGHQSRRGKKEKEKKGVSLSKLAETTVQGEITPSPIGFQEVSNTYNQGRIQARPRNGGLPRFTRRGDGLANNRHYVLSRVLSPESPEGKEGGRWGWREVTDNWRSRQLYMQR